MSSADEIELAEITRIINIIQEEQISSKNQKFLMEAQEAMVIHLSV